MMGCFFIVLYKQIQESEFTNYFVKTLEKADAMC
jgi:hypothetical protein